MNLKLDDLKLKLKEDIVASKQHIESLMTRDLIDEDGYPTVEALEIIRIWHWTDSKGWFDFIHSIWYLSDWGWYEGPEPHQWKENETCYHYNISTAGWSGNESIIEAMKKNSFMWSFTWVQSRRGGHYIFELKEYNDE